MSHHFQHQQVFRRWLRRSQDLFDPLGALEVTREAEQFGVIDTIVECGGGCV